MTPKYSFTAKAEIEIKSVPGHKVPLKLIRKTKNILLLRLLSMKKTPIPDMLQFFSKLHPKENHCFWSNRMSNILKN